MHAENHRCLNDDVAKAELFNKYFLSVSSLDDNNVVLPNEDKIIYDGN